MDDDNLLAAHISRVFNKFTSWVLGATVSGTTVKKNKIISPSLRSNNQGFDFEKLGNLRAGSNSTVRNDRPSGSTSVPRNTSTSIPRTNNVTPPPKTTGTAAH
eukprot:TRINITY_DN626_c0_g3_i2.p1 TRINITY_DN626_c0_g3~~TRINITY_DN626_c0_g3_i2.p1  ORF type:complete len:103 (+),score=15.85 TRINITY_DN626_c0_g3_i2:41-349(+)